MHRSPLPYRVLVGAATLAAMILLWTGSAIHYGQGDSSDPVALIADVRDHGPAIAAKALTDIASMLCFVLAAIGLAATVRGRGRTFTLTVAVLTALGVPSHVLGASFMLTLIKVDAAELPDAEQTRVVSELVGLQNLYFIGLVPFLLAMLLLPAALWRARIVSWIPLSLLAVDLVIIGRFTDSTTPSSPIWWIDPIVTVVAYGWLAVGIMRYRPVDHEAPIATPATPEPVTT